ncbi:hypothetical protein HYH03_014517 [Edaphochlamys debaryana]|uniref:CDP-diacylglycerol--glycerol-3-phosphate 3-phosphatidyltransferase n=1 Tax=Edaphochlamys debaryana TaxID=47281 RepID=A0A836BTH1_9CHLO|nr:hypothetical protein HYH03_014517 [Edaphochlamys debaryana]|eukprot:KAG2486834.1 hypothetical protein HYH03_014517 [Edaphochlamys debaryana]
MADNSPDGVGVEQDIPRVPLLLVQKQAESLISPIDRRSDYYRHAALVVPHKPIPQPLMTIPNILTYFRLLLVPVLLLVWEMQHKYNATLCAVMFIAASVTDYFDGYLARRLKIATVFGAFLDPVADKIMVATALVLLAVSPPAPWTPQHMIAPVVLIICREITMSSLREWAAAAGGGASKAVKVNTLGKWKTALQMVSMSLLLIVREPIEELFPNSAGSTAFLTASRLAYVALWGGTVLGLWSLAIYFANVWQHFIYPETKKQH